MDFKQLQKAVANLSWNMSFYEFCREILRKENWTNEQLENDNYCLEKWKKWQELNSALHSFDDESLKRIITVYEQREVNR